MFEHGTENRLRKLLTPEALIALMIGVLVFILYLPTLGFEFVNWDDGVYVYNNQALKNMGAGYLAHAFTKIVNSNYHPLTMLSYKFDVLIWGLDPKGFHLTNILFHAINSSIVALLCMGLMRAAGDRNGTSPLGAYSALLASGLTGLMFGLHPLHVESVAWVSERKDVLYAFFFLLGLLAYLRYAASGKPRHYALTFTLFLASMLSKPMAVTFPVVLLLLDLYPLKREALGFWRKLLPEKSPFFIVAILIGIITVVFQDKGIPTFGELRLYEHPLLALRGTVFYIEKLFYPVGLAPFYRADTTPFDLSDAAALLFVLGVTAAGVVFYLRKKRLYLSLWMFYLVTASPVLGFVQAGAQGVADRYTYVPLLAIMFFLALVVARAGEVPFRQKYGKLLSRGGVLLLCALVVAGMAGTTSKQIRVWENSFTLWERERQIFPFEPLALMQLGLANYSIGRYKRAEFYYTSAIQINSYNARYYKLRAMAYMKMRKFRLANSDLERSLQLNPKDIEAKQFLSVVRRSL